MNPLTRLGLLIPLALGAAAGCGDDPAPPCEQDRLPFRSELRCFDEFAAQAARPLDAALPGAFTVKTIVDRATADSVTFQDTVAYPIHSRFAVEHLGYPPGQPFVNEYFSPQRRLVLGSITYYEEPGVWAYELAPYDSASAELIAHGFEAVRASAPVAAALRFHPTSIEQEARAAALPASVPIITTDELFAGISYQPLNLGETYAQVRILAAADLATTYVSPRELVVLDRVPNDIAVVAGVVTEELQTPLSHVNVLAQQRRTPNMGLRGARAAFAPYADRWVRLTVSAFGWDVAEVSADEAEAWWQAHRPPPLQVTLPDYSVTTILNVDDVGPGDVARVGGKAGNYGQLRDLGPPVRIRDGLVVPVSYYRDFVVSAGLDTEITSMLADPAFRADGNVRRVRLGQLQDAFRAAPIPPATLAAIEARLEAEFPATRLKFRSSTNAEDLDGFTGAGLYDSRSGQVGDPARPVADALRAVWASLWNVRAFEERAYRSIDHQQVAMAVLVHPSFDDELANGVAITANIYDPAAGGEDAFYVNAQLGEASVVSPDPDITADVLVYYFFHNGQPATYYGHSSYLATGSTVLSRAELFDLGQSLQAIRDGFASIYQPPPGYGALPMDVEWKLSLVGTERQIWIKQARPFPGRDGAE